MKYRLCKLDKNYKGMVAAALFSLTIGMLIGLVYLYYISSYSHKKVVENFMGSEIENVEFEIHEKYPKPVSEIFITTHNNIIGFTLIFTFVGIIFSINSI
jgi:hypothetical protein